MLIWWCIHFAHYYMGKRIVTNVSEEKLVEIMSTPLFYTKNQRTSKRFERYAFVPILLIYVPIVWLYTLLFKEIQRIILPSEGVTFTGGYVVLPAILVGIGTLAYIVFRIAAYQNVTKDKWIAQPTLKECQKRVARLKRIGTRWSWITQVLFVVTMLFYTNIDDKGVTNSKLLDLGATVYPYSEIDYVETSVDLQKFVSSRGGKRDEFIYRYFIMFKNGEKIELWDAIDEFGWNQDKVERLKQITFYFKENDTHLKVDYPSFLDRAKYKRLLNTEEYQKLKDYLDVVRNISEGVPNLIPKGKDITIDSVVYRIDSVTTGIGEGFFKASKGKTYLFVHMTAHNEQLDSVYVNTFNMEIHDKMDSVYRHSIFGDDTFEPKIPPNKTHSGAFAFQIPKDVALPLVFRYRNGVIDKRYYWFELMDSTDVYLLE